MDGMTPRDPSPGNPPGAHLFVDESKERDYVLVAGVIAPADLATTRAFTRNQNPANGSSPMPSPIPAFEPVVYTADRGNDELAARAACLNALIEDAAQMGARTAWSSRGTTP
jgi:hypothetical protein